MRSPADRYRSGTRLASYSVLTGVALLAVAYCARDKFLSSAALTFAGVAFGLAAIPAVYDVYQRSARRSLWRRVRQQVSRTLAGRIYMLTMEFYWRLCPPGYTGYGQYVIEADVDPDSVAMSAHSKRIENLLTIVDRFEQDYSHYIVLSHMPDMSINGEYLVKTLREVMTNDLRATLRAEIAPLAQFAEESHDLLLGIEDFLASAWWTAQYGGAAQAGELGEAEFIRGFRDLILQLKALYARAGADWQAAASAT